MKLRSGKILLILALGLCGLAKIAAAQQGAAANRTAANVQASPESMTPVTVHAAQRGNPHINLRDGHALPTNYAVSANGGSAQMSNAQPLALASADFDEDGVPDLVSAFAVGDGTGIITVHRGNVNALWPYGPALLNGLPPEFLPDARVFNLPEQPDFLGAGDFNADGHWDIVAARRGSNALWLLLGDGHGGFGAPQRVQLPGGVTALVTGEINRADGLTDIVVGVNGANGAQVLVFEAPNGAMRAEPEIIAASAAVTALALGRIDGGAFFDLAIGAGNQLMMVHGRDRKLSLGSDAKNSVGQPNIVQQALPFSVRALAVGNFSGLANLAALGDDGAVHLLENSHAIGNLALMSLSSNSVSTPGRNGNKVLPGADSPAANMASRQQQLVRAAVQRTSELQKSAQAAGTPAEWTVFDSIALPSSISAGGDAAFSGQLVTARISTSPTDDLLVVDSGASQIHVLSNTAEWTTASRKANTVRTTPGAMSNATSFDVTGGPVAVLPMRLNQHPLQSLVLLANGTSAPIVSVSVPPLLLVVTSTGDQDGITTTLRGAINFSNVVATGTDAPPVSITFDIPLSDPGCDQNTHVCTIRPTSVGKEGGDEHALPALFGPVTIDGYTQPGASPNTLPNGDNAVILIRVDGSAAATPGGEGFDIFEQPGTIRGINIAGWHNPDLISQPGFAVGGFGIRMDGVAAYAEGNFIGTNVSGTGSDVAADSNILGVFLANGPTLGSGALGNVVGGTTPQARNIISGNRAIGIQGEFDTPLTQIQGNFIGTDATGTNPLGNSSDGILAPRFATIGGTLPGARNVISTNGNTDIDINAIDGLGLGTGDLVQGNFIGTDATGTKAFASDNDEAILLAVNYQMATIGGTTPAARNIISGTSAGIELFDGVFNNLIEGNYIGIDVTGTQAMGNKRAGILSDNADFKPPAGGLISGLPPYSNTIGGAVPGAGNVISGNTGDGIKLAGANTFVTPANLIGDVIQGNLIGTDATGTHPIPNGGNGIWLTSSTITNNGTDVPMNNIIGGTDIGLANVISNNVGHGVFMDSGLANVTIGNVIQNNGGAGVRITSGNGNLISRNSIFGNGALGIDLDTAGPNANSPCQANTNGANLLQNAPVLTAGSGSTIISATATDPNGNTSEFSNAVQGSLSGNVLSLLGNFNGKANTVFTIEFFSSPSADASGFGQGQTFLGSTSVTSNATCTAPISLPVNTTQADVAVTLSLNVSNLTQGPDFGREVYTAVVSNNGAATAHNVVFTDPLPAALQVSSTYCNLPSCQSPVTSTVGTCVVSANNITCNLGTMAPGATGTIKIPVQALIVGSVTNTVNANATETDPNPANNVASLTNNILNAFPVTESIVPTNIVMGSPDLPLMIFGVNFLPATVVKFNGTTLPTTFFDNQVCPQGLGTTYCAALQIVIPAAMLTTAGDATISVTNGTFSSSMTFSGFIESACQFNVLAPSSPISVGLDGEIAQFTTQSLAPNCSWKASSSVPWITQLDSDLAAGASRTGSSRASYSVAPNSTGAARSGSITQAGQTITFNEAAGTPCTFALNPSSIELSSAAATGTFTVTASDPGCLWQAQSFGNSITVTLGAGGEIGSGTVNYSVAANTGGPRSGSIVIASINAGGSVFSITQDPPNNCFFTLASTTENFPTFGGTGTFAVTASQPSCAWTASSDSAFATITSGSSGTGNGTVNFTVASNAGNGRMANITVGNTLGSSAIFSATQVSFFTCTFALTPTSVNFSNAGGTGTIGATQSYSFCLWTAQSNNPDAVLLGRTSGAFGDTLTYTVAQNTGPDRVLTVTFGCQTFTIFQGGTAPGNPVPAVTTLAPPSVAVAGPDFTLTVNGSNFVNGATVLFNGLPRVTTFVNSGQLTAAIFAHDIDLAGTRTVVVTNPVPGGGVSNTVTFNVTGTNPVPVITSLLPPNGTSGVPAFTLTVNGTGFDSASVVSFGGIARATTFVSPTQLTAAILASDVATAGTPAVIVTNPTPGGGPSNSVTFNVTSPVPTVTSISPTTVAAGSGQLVMTVQGTNFVTGCTVNFGASAESTVFLNPFVVLAIIPATDVANAGTPAVTVTNPGGSPSNAMTFTITAAGTNPAPTVTTIFPTGVIAGSGGFTLTINGTNFISASVVNFNGAAKTTTFVSSTQVTALILAGDVASVGTPGVTVTNPTPGGGTSNAATFNISSASNPVPAITTVAPASGAAGSGAFTLTVNGTNFVAASVVNFNGFAKSTVFVSATQLTASILAIDVASGGTDPVTVTNPAPAGGTSNSVNFTVNNPAPLVTTLSPASVPVGSAAFTLTVNGSNFVSGAVVNFNGNARATSFQSATQVSATILSTDIAAAGTFNVNVTNPAPGGGTSNTVSFAVNNPVPTVTALSPTGATAGSGALTLTVNGTNFISGSVVNLGGSPRVTTFVNATQLTAAILAADVTSVGTPAISVTNPAPGGGASNSVNFNITAATNPVPTIISFSPTGVTVGSGAFTLTVNGTNFISSSAVNFGGSARVTTFVSATQLTAAILATDVTSVGTSAITVTNPTPGGGTSNSVNFNIGAAPNPVPTVTTLSPANVTVGSGAFTLTVNGTNFLNTSVVNFGGAARTTTFVSATQLTAAILAGDVASAGTPSVTVTNPAPGGGTSTAVALTVSVAPNPVPAISSLSPNTVSAGSGAFTLTVNGSNFVNTSVVQWNGSVRVTTFVSATQLSAAITAADVQTANVLLVSVFNPAPGGGASNSLQLSVTTPIPALSTLVPNSAIAGGAAFTLTVNGGNFISTSIVQWNGSNRTTTFVNATQLTAAITAADILTAGTASVKVFTPTVVFSRAGGVQPLGAPSGTTSNALTFTINAANPVPTLTTLVPTTTGAGSAAFTLTLTGTNFISSSVAQWKGSARTTTFVSATNLTAAITAADIATSGTAAITVVNPTPGGGTSNALTFTITDFSVTATTTTQTVTAGQSASFTIATATVGGAFPGTVTFTASGLPTGASASFSPSSVPAGTSTTMTVTTTARGSAQMIRPPFSPNIPMKPLWLIAIVLTLALTTLSLAKSGRRRMRRLIPIGAFALLLISVSYSSGCSGGGFPKVGSNTGTPAGTYTVTVTGTSGAVQHSTTVTLVVQ